MIFNRKFFTSEESLHITFDESLPKSSHNICIDDDIISTSHLLLMLLLIYLMLILTFLIKMIFLPIYRKLLLRWEIILIIWLLKIFHKVFKLDSNWILSSMLHFCLLLNLKMSKKHVLMNFELLLCKKSWINLLEMVFGILFHDLLIILLLAPNGCSKTSLMNRDKLWKIR